MFLFPWFLEKAQVKPDVEFRYIDRVYSTMNGFYYIRLLDDVTDHHAMDESGAFARAGFLSRGISNFLPKPFCRRAPLLGLFPPCLASFRRCDNARFEIE